MSICKVVECNKWKQKQGWKTSLDEIEKLSMSMESIASVTEEQAASSEEILATTENLLKVTSEVVENMSASQQFCEISFSRHRKWFE